MLDEGIERLVVVDSTDTHVSYASGSRATFSLTSTRRADLNAPELTRWLLPGHLGTLPIHPAHMSDQLTAVGVTARDGSHAALVDLAAALPPPVLASLLGVHVNTAIAWSHRAQQDWSAYLAARHREQAGSTPHARQQGANSAMGVQVPSSLGL